MHPKKETTVPTSVVEMVHPLIGQILSTTLGLEQSPVERAKQSVQERDEAFKERWNRGLDGMCEGGEKV